MSPERIRPEIVPVPKEYDPGYPSELTDEEFREWVAASNHSRFRKLVLAGSLLWGSGCSGEAATQEQVTGAPAEPAKPEESSKPASPAEPAGADSREARVLRHLMELQFLSASWFDHATYPETTDPSIPLVPRVPISFGNSLTGFIDSARARQVALEIFRAYGLEVAADATIREPGAVARLDGWAAGARVGFLLRNSWDQGEAALTDEELERFRAAGHRLHVAESESYRAYDGDTFTSTIGYLAGVLDFLNSVTDGPDVELSALLRGPNLEIPLKELEIRTQSGEALPLSDRSSWTAKDRSTITIRQPKVLEGASEEGSRGFSLLLIRATQFTVFTVGAPPPEFKESPWEVRLRQPETGTELQSRSLTLFPPATFDPRRPFEIDLTLGPGDFSFSGLLVRTRH